MLRLDTGNTGFMLLCSSLVMLMTPGLAFFYGGLVGRKNVLAIMIQSFVSLCWTTVLWYVCGYSLCFSGGAGGVIGDLHMAFLRGVDVMAPSPNDSIPLIVHIAYQMMFAIITPALITGAFANRVTFKAYFIFLNLWLLLVYFPFVHMMWGGGLLAKLGALDFAGGIVVHNIAGMAALASVLYVGRRRVQDRGPHSIPLVALGTGLLWFGWYGFNAGSEFRVDAVTATAFLNTDIAASFAGMAWFFVEWATGAKPKFLGLLTGSVAGLATITPAAGYVSPNGAVIIGIVSGVVCFYAVALKNRLNWDDAHQGLQPGRRGRVVLRQSRVLHHSGAGRGGILHLGVRFHARHAVADRSRHARPRRHGPRGDGARRGAARRAGLPRGHLVPTRRARHAVARRLLLAVWAAGACVSPALAAQGEGASLPPWLAEVTLNGFLSSSYSYNFNRPASLTNQFRVFDVNDNTFALDEFELVAQKAVTRPRDAGFRVDLTLGSSVPPVTASPGLFRDASGKAGNLDMHQAYASWMAPLGSGLRLDAGKFITHHGYEVIDGYDGWNDNATRSFLFGYAIPFTHVGLRASYSFSPQVAGMLMLVNGWDVAVDNNRSKSVGAQLALTPARSLSIYLNAMVGPERANVESDPRTLVDLAATWKPRDRVTVGGNGDFGHETGAVDPGRSATWSGVAGYLHATVIGPFALALRGEYFADPDGVRTGVAQYLTEGTLTPELSVSPHAIVRADVRVDHSNREVFERESGRTQTQPTFLLEWMYSF